MTKADTHAHTHTYNSFAEKQNVGGNKVDVVEINKCYLFWTQKSQTMAASMANVSD